jgi:uncharacterized RDD family membrane protein YckC
MSNPLATTEIIPAGIGRRLGAIFYDSLLVLALWFLTLLFFAMATDSNSAAVEPTPALYVQLVCSAETFLFFYFFWMYRGRTLGMMAWHTHLATVSGEVPGAKHILLRILGATLNLASLGLGYLWILIDEQQRSFSDILSGTRILRD